MEYSLEIKSFEGKKGQKYKIIHITDIQLHATPKRPTPSVGKKVRMSFETNEPDRIYSHIEKTKISDKKAYVLDLLKMDPDFVKMVQEEEAKGFKILIELPSEGIPILVGKDTIEFMKSKNGKRAIRGLAKEKNEE